MNNSHNKLSELDPDKIEEFNTLNRAWMSELFHRENIDVMEVVYTYSYMSKEDNRIYELVFKTKLSDSKRIEVNYPPLLEDIYWRVDDETRVELDHPEEAARVANEFSNELWGVTPYAVMTDEEVAQHKTDGWEESK